MPVFVFWMRKGYRCIHAIKDRDGLLYCMQTGSYCVEWACPLKRVRHVATV